MMMSVSPASLPDRETLTARLIKPRLADGLLLLLAGAMVLGFVLIATIMDEAGFPLDDSWIHQTYARNLGTAGEWAFIPGDSSAASTAPFYTALLAIGHWIGLSPFVWAHFLGVLALFGAGAIGMRLAERLFPRVPWVGPVTGGLLIGSWHLIWAAASGMETMLFMTLSLAVIALSWREMDPVSQAPGAGFGRGMVLGAVGGLLFLTRPEGIGLVGLAGLVVLASRVHPRPRTALFWAVGVSLGWLVIVTPYVIYNYAQVERLLPTTASAKVAEYEPLRDRSLPVRYLRMVFPLIPGPQFLWLPGGIWGVLAVARRTSHREWLYFLPLVWAFAHLTLFVFRLPAPYQHGRYMMPLLPPLLIYAAGGMYLLVDAGKTTAFKRVITRTVAISAVLSVPAFWWLGGQAYGRDVRIINTEMVKTAKWIRDHPEIIPSDELLAVHDIGALGYYAPREILDLAGLVSPEVIPIITDDQALMDLMCERGAKWLMVLPEQQPARDDDPRLELVYSTNEPYIKEAGAEGNMRVFRLHFDESCDAPPDR
ncbi:MAG: hypothetical protein GYB66_08745 [Chloroflexi bacterium]|nr:hypothetical protein [Chloroflexota bacterium]